MKRRLVLILVILPTVIGWFGLVVGGTERVAASNVAPAASDGVAASAVLLVLIILVKKLLLDRRRQSAKSRKEISRRFLFDSMLFAVPAIACLIAPMDYAFSDWLPARGFLLSPQARAINAMVGVGAILF